MRKLVDAIQKEGQSDLRAQKAILRIYQWMEKAYPKHAASSRAMLIRRCLQELTKEGALQRQ